MICKVAHPLELLFGGGVGLSCGHGGELSADSLHGLFAGDTRVLSTYRFTIAGQSWCVLSHCRPGPSSAQWDMQNPPVRAPGGDLPEGLLHGRLRRRVSGALHDDLTVTSFASQPIAVRLSLQLDADFADIFQVKDRSTPPRLGVSRITRPDELSLLYERRGFQRALHVRFDSSGESPSFVGPQAIFDLVLEPKQTWRCCVEAVPELDGRRLEFAGNPHVREMATRAAGNLSIDTAELLAAPFERGCLDLERLAFSNAGGGRFIAAGAPWFLALFGRDTLVTSLMAGVFGSWHVRGTLAALAATQATVVDDFRDAQPGKIAHELRYGELARFGAIPHTPYYGSHDAPALFVLALWNAFRWTGDRALLAQHLPAAEAALGWCEQLGDEDGDGLLEYQSRSDRGYFNQGWKDACDAVPHDDGTLAELPIAVVELQGYWYAARLAMAELLEAVAEHDRANALREAARELRQRVEDRYWLERAGCYALALDGRKQLVKSISSNPGHLLWCGLPSRERASRLAERLLARDMWSGYGVRTLSVLHPSYNPLSYQLGSVWPHDNALLAAGLARYGLHEPAARITRGILEAAAAFEQQRLPELFAGFERDDAPPIPYLKANVPQAWAAAAPLLAAQIFLGLLPDAPNGRCYVQPWLPPWLPALTLHGIEVGEGQLDVKIELSGSDTRIRYARHPSLELIAGTPEAPLWGAPSSRTGAP
jgi:glycogen debranching enzyme